MSKTLKPKKNYLFILIIIAVGVIYFSKNKEQEMINQQENEIQSVIVNDFFQTIENKITPKGIAPKNMKWISGGTFAMGTNAKCESLCQVGGITSDCSVHKVYVDGFWMDEHEVTNAEFAQFVKATHYKTIAEIAPTTEEFPDAQPEMLVPGSIVFSPPANAVSLDDYLFWWTYSKGANWKHPLEANSNNKGKENFPVVHVAWEDAMAYAKWANKRLPTEAEWEFAGRGGLSEKKFEWGNTFAPNGIYMANTFQGQFPNNNSALDGFKGIAPVKQYHPNSFGLYDMTGNVWEWCSDWYQPVIVKQSTNSAIDENPQGPTESYDPAEPGVAKKVHRGGSFLCTEQYCSRYVMGTRGKGDWRTGTNHLGFRCVKSIMPIK